MTEKFGSAIYLVLVLHAYMMFIALYCGWIGWRVRFLGDLKLVRDANHAPLPHGADIANQYGNSYIVVATTLALLATATPFGLPFAVWLVLSFVVIIAQRLYRSELESRAKARNSP
jgi:hypothetical protein